MRKRRGRAAQSYAWKGTIHFLCYQGGFKLEPEIFMIIEEKFVSKMSPNVGLIMKISSFYLCRNPKSKGLTFLNMLIK